MGRINTIKCLNFDTNLNANSNLKEFFIYRQSKSFVFFFFYTFLKFDIEKELKFRMINIIYFLQNNRLNLIY